MAPPPSRVRPPRTRSGSGAAAESRAQPSDDFALAQSDRRGRSGSEPRRSREPSPVMISPSRVRPPRTIRGSEPRHRRDSLQTECPRSRGVAATRLRGIATSRPRWRRDTSPRTTRADTIRRPLSSMPTSARRLHGISTLQPRRHRDSWPRNIRVAAAESTRAGTIRRDLSPRPRMLSPALGISTWQPRWRRDPSAEHPAAAPPRPVCGISARRNVRLRLVLEALLDGRHVGDGVVELDGLARRLLDGRRPRLRPPRGRFLRRRRHREEVLGPRADLAPELVSQVLRDLDLVALGQKRVEAVDELAVALEERRDPADDARRVDLLALEALHDLEELVVDLGLVAELRLDLIEVEERVLDLQLAELLLSRIIPRHRPRPARVRRRRRGGAQVRRRRRGGAQVRHGVEAEAARGAGLSFGLAGWATRGPPRLAGVGCYMRGDPGISLRSRRVPDRPLGASLEAPGLPGLSRRGMRPLEALGHRVITFCSTFGPPRIDTLPAPDPCNAGGRDLPPNLLVARAERRKARRKLKGRQDVVWRAALAGRNGRRECATTCTFLASYNFGLPLMRC